MVPLQTTGADVELSLRIANFRMVRSGIAVKRAAVNVSINMCDTNLENLKSIEDFEFSGNWKIQNIFIFKIIANDGRWPLTMMLCLISSKRSQLTTCKASYPTAPSCGDPTTDFGGWRYLCTDVGQKNDHEPFHIMSYGDLALRKTSHIPQEDWAKPAILSDFICCDI